MLIGLFRQVSKADVSSVSPSVIALTKGSKRLSSETPYLSVKSLPELANHILSLSVMCEQATFFYGRPMKQKVAVTGNINS